MGDSVVITPEKGRLKEIGKQLLELADSPYDVQWVTWPAAGYAVPLELFNRFDSLGSDTADDGEEPEKEPRKRRRGRPRKEETSTDNNTSEEEE